MDELPPPWVAVTGLTPDEPGNQGLAETYIGLNWLPFWNSLTPEGKAGYLDRWAASTEWREAIALRYDQEEFDVEADAREADEWANVRRQEASDENILFWERVRRGGST